MSAILQSIPFLGRMLSWLRQLPKRWHARSVDPGRRLRKILGRLDGLSVVQIGSNDGRAGDPVFSLLQSHPTWTALLVEPVPDLFLRLMETYQGGSNVRFENVAIADQEGSSPFFMVNPSALRAIPDLPPWWDQLGSFDRNHILKHFGPVIETHISEITIPTLPLADVLARNHVSRIDLLHIDTEGFDWHVLRQLDLTQFQPKVILFEYRHLPEAEHAAAIAYLQPLYRLSHLDVTGDLLCELKR